MVGVRPGSENPEHLPSSGHHVKWAGSPWRALAPPPLPSQKRLRSWSLPDAAQETPGHISFQTSGWLVPTEASGGSRQTWRSEWQQLNSFLRENIGALIASSDTWDGNYSVPLLRH